MNDRRNSYTHRQSQRRPNVHQQQRQRQQARSSADYRSASGYGAHGAHGRHSANADSLHFSNRNMGDRASRSQVSNIGARTSSAESRAAYSRRTSQLRFAESYQRRTRIKRIATIVIVAVVVLGIAIGAGYLAFRGTVGSGFALKGSNAGEALVQVKSTEPYYTLVTAELGAAAEPLEQEGPDVVMLVRIDRQNHTLAIVNIPSNLQVTVDTNTRRLADIASEGDAALISAVSTFAKVDISHIVKLDEQGLRDMIDALGGIDINVDQEIDDPHAGSIYIPAGNTTLDSDSAITYLRATNLTLGETDQLAHQSYFAAALLNKVLGASNPAGQLDAIGGCFQTDLSLGDIEDLSSWVKDLGVDGITRITLPGYTTAVTGVVDTGDAMYVAKADDMAAIIEALDNGTTPTFADTSHVEPADPASFTLEVQNGTDIAGAATTTTDSLKAKGFRVEKSGNAKQQVYDETLVVYKNDQTGPAQAQAVINALGLGRAVDGAAYYEFDTDILLVIGYDYKPVS